MNKDAELAKAIFEVLALVSYRHVNEMLPISIPIIKNVNRAISALELAGVLVRNGDSFYVVEYKSIL